MAANERPGVAQLTLQSAHVLSIVEYQEQGCCPSYNKFIYIDIGCHGRVSDGGVFQ
uniref:Uncharacterized protein n=1 Tax=Amphimedon queenslandica TaxID=400682 RepID=A0A1X7TT64_AMPQE